MRRRAVVGSIMTALLTACAATQPRAATTPTAAVAVVNEPTATATPAAISPAPSVAPSTTATRTASATAIPIASPAAAATDATTALVDQNGPVTASMAQVGIAGARYATLGDPNAPLTIVEYSDFG